MTEKDTYKLTGQVSIEKTETKLNDTYTTDSKTNSITFDVNMRVDNHTRNAVLALARATADKRTASAMVSILIENYLNSMTPQDLEVYQDFLDMLEQKDKLEHKLKNK